MSTNDSNDIVETVDEQEKALLQGQLANELVSVQSAVSLENRVLSQLEKDLAGIICL
jgi:hypothetical protein